MARLTAILVAGPSRWSEARFPVSRGSCRRDAAVCCDCHHGRPTMLRKAALLVAALAAIPTVALAQLPLPVPIPLTMPQGTPEARASCAPDVQKYCEAALPDPMRVLACLQANRSRISRACNQVLISHGQ